MRNPRAIMSVVVVGWLLLTARVPAQSPLLNAQPGDLPEGVTLTPIEVGGHDHGPEGFCGGVTAIVTDKEPPTRLTDNFTLQLTYDANVPGNWRTVIDFAAEEWRDVLQSRGVNPDPYAVTVRRADLGTEGPLAHTFTGWNSNSGVLVDSSIEFNTRYAWFVDPTPADDSDVPGSIGFDLLSVARHELGHAVGWLGAGNARVGPLVNGATFDAPRLNIALAASNNTAHASATAHPGELMQPSIGTSTRRAIALYPTVARVSRSFEYAIPMQFADPAFGGTPNGSASAPWRSFAEANAMGSGSLPILLAPRTFLVTRGATFSITRRFFSARGEAIVTVP